MTPISSSPSYSFARFFYCLPLAFLLLFPIDYFFGNRDLLYLGFSLFSMLPCGLIGLLCSVIGLSGWKKIGEEHRVKGRWLIALGIIMLSVGAFSTWLIYLIITSG